MLASSLASRNNVDHGSWFGRCRPRASHGDGALASSDQRWQSACLDAVSSAAARVPRGSGSSLNGIPSIQPPAPLSSLCGCLPSDRADLQACLCHSQPQREGRLSYYSPRPTLPQGDAEGRERGLRGCCPSTWRGVGLCLHASDGGATCCGPEVTGRRASCASAGAPGELAPLLPVLTPPWRQPETAA